MRKVTTFIAILWCARLFGQEQVINPDTALQVTDVTVTAERLQLPLSLVSRNVSILSAEDIKKLPVQSVNEALAHVSGVDVRQRGVAGSQADIGIRGSSFDQVLLMIDGVKVIDPQTGHHMMNLPLNVEYIERIEVLKGSAARVYGANAYAGVINIVTKKVEGKSAVAKVFGGDFGLMGASAAATTNEGIGNQLISVDYTVSDGYRPGNDFASMSGLYKLDKQLTNKLTTSFLGTFNRRKLGAAGYYVANSTEYEEVITGMVHGKLGYTSRNLTLNSSLGWRYNDDHYIYIRLKPEVFQNRHHTHVMMADVQGNYRWKKLGTTGFGADFRRDEIYSTNLGNRQRNFYNVYLDQMVHLLGTKITFGANVNYADGYGFEVFPGIDFSHRISGRMTAYLAVNKSYRVPTYTDLYYKGPSNIGNPDLQPEKAWNYELGYKFFTKNWFAQVSGFVRESENLIDWVRANASQPYQPVNYHQVTLTGAETEIRRNNLWIFDQLAAGYTFMDAKLTVPQGRQSRYSLGFLKHQAQARATFKLLKTIYITAAYRYNERINQPAYHLLDGRVACRMTGLELFAEVSNITNTAYVEAGFVPMPGRWARGGVIVRLK